MHFKMYLSFLLKKLQSGAWSHESFKIPAANSEKQYSYPELHTRGPWRTECDGSFMNN